MQRLSIEFQGISVVLLMMSIGNNLFSIGQIILGESYDLQESSFF